MLLPSVALAQAPISLHASYDTYAAGMHVAQVEAGLSFGPSTYQMNLGFQTIGMAGFFFGGRQFDFVNGSWHGMQAKPSRFVGKGSWRGIERQAQIEYQDSKPIIRQLVPPNDVEREPVPAGLQANTVDTLSALAELIRVVDATGRCETSVRTYDGRRVLEIDAHTAGEEVLQPTSRSSFAGKALRCDFLGRMRAGFLLGDDQRREGKPMRGSAWMAAVGGGPRLPVRLEFETKWLGEATMYLTGLGSGLDVSTAQGN